MFFNIKRALSMFACASALALACAPSAFATDATTTLITLDGGNQSLSSTTLSADDSADELASAIKDQALATQAVSVGKIVICLDPGHGGSDGGASGNGVTEADANLAIAQACKTRLESYGIFKVVMTRTSDSTVGLHDRVPYAQSQGADLFVSIHNNSSTSSGAHGSEVWIQNSSSYLKSTTHDPAERVASQILNNLGNLGLAKRGVFERDSTDNETYPDNSTADYYTVLYESRMAGIPAMIVEHAFVSNSGDADYLDDSASLTSLGKADADGIAATFNCAFADLKLDSVAYKPSETMTMSIASLRGDTSGVRYNYCIKPANSWTGFQSTVKQTGSTTTSESASFKLPSTPGTYVAWADVYNKSGYVTYTDDITFAIDARALDWNAVGTNAPASVTVGDTVTFSAAITGTDTDKLTYNYCIMYNNSWSGFASTVNSSGSYTSDTSNSFIASREGVYTVWVDVRDTNGKTVTTKEANIVVQKKGASWSASKAVVSASSVNTGDTVTISTDASGADKSSLTYNYCIMYNNSWNNFTSTVKQTGKATSASSYSFTADKSGSYCIWVNVYGPDGKSVQTPDVYVKSAAKPYSWTVSKATANVSVASLGDKVTITTDAAGADADKLTYNYCVMYNNSWSDFTSTVKATGKTTSDTSYTFTPSKVGTYTVWVNVYDPNGKTVQTPDVNVKAATKVYNWTASKAVASSTSVTAGDTITITTDAAGSDADKLGYNYCVMYNNSWNNFTSTVKRTGTTTSNTSYSFKATKTGIYTVWVNITDPSGRSIQTPDVNIQSSPVTYNWSVSATNASPNPASVGDTITVSANASGADASTLTYNYCVMYNNSWSDFTSTVKQTGKATSDTSYSFKATKAGTYTVWINVYDPTGKSSQTSDANITVRDNEAALIMGSAQTSVAQMVKRYTAVGATYPSVYASKGAATIDDYCTILYEEATAEGVRPEVLFAQAMHETGWLKFGGQVKVEQCNFGGLGAADDGASGATFADVRTGLRAQVQHLKAYASTDALKNSVVDPRFTKVTRGSATTVYALAGRWATDPQYGDKLMGFINDLLKA